MASFNSLTLVGNFVRDPELRVTPKGTSICQGGIAVNRKYKAEDGSNREEVTFVDWEAWGKTADIISKFCSKGSSVLLAGRLKMDQWEDKQTGQKRSKLKMVVEQVQFLSLGNGQGQSEGRQEDAPSEFAPPPAGFRMSDTRREQPRNKPQPGPGGQAFDPNDIDEDVPF